MTQIEKTYTLNDLTETASKKLALQTKVAMIEEQLAEVKKELEFVECTELPQMMDAVGMSEFKLSTGEKLTVKTIYAGRANTLEAFNWLRCNGGGDMIKHELIVKTKGDLDEEELRMAKKVLEDLEIPFDEKDTVHHATLGAFIRERTEAGEDLTTAPLNVFIGRRAVIK
jgi:hypothetical protein